MSNQPTMAERVKPNTRKLTKPCAECPYSRTCQPGGTGGSDPLTYVGQAYGPFFLPCHMQPGYMEDRESHKNQQCAGAAIFRSNIGRAEILSAAISPATGEHLHSLPPDTNLVFATPSQFVSHPMKVPLPAVEFMLTVVPPEIIMLQEMGIANRRQAAKKSG